MKSPFERVAELPALVAYSRRASSADAGVSETGPSGGEKVCRLCGAVRGLLGGARSLAVGALARARSRAAPPSSSSYAPGQADERGRHDEAKREERRPGTISREDVGVVLAVVDVPETALDVIADLRAFLAVEERARTEAGAGGAPDALGADGHPLPARGAARTGQPPLGRGRRDGPPSADRHPPPPPSELRASCSEDWAQPGVGTLPPQLQRGSALETALFPAWDVLPTESDRPESEALAGRQRILARLRQVREGADGHPASEPAATPAGGAPGADLEVHTTTRDGPPSLSLPADSLPASLVVTAPITALLQPCEAPDETAPALVLRAGSSWDPIALGRKLDELGYERTGQVEARGEFALRGGILDVFPYAADQPFRFDFDGDLIETIRPFNPISQRSEERVDAVVLADSSPQRLRRLFTPGARGGPSSLLDHLPPRTLVVWIEPPRLRERAELYAASLVSGRSLYLSYDEVRARARARFDSLDLDSGVRLDCGLEIADCGLRGEEAPAGEQPPARGADAHPPSAIPVPPSEAACTSLQRLQGEISAHAAEWKRLAASRLALYVFCETPGDRRRLETLLTEAGVLPAPSIRLVPGRVSGGFDLRAAGLAAISDREIFGRHKHAATAPLRRARRGADVRPLSSLFELQIGDCVVHAGHGIGRYLGLARLGKSGRLEDYLTLLYADDVKLYVPAAHIQLVSRYIGSQAAPELARLGAKAWARKKERARQALRDIAEELLKTQAARKSRPGICFGPDGEWQTAFEAAFPYEETPDQLAAIGAAKDDMEATCPMDRLLCGDVGFGKTEVAVRAAFKAVAAGKQVAVLTPTTLLCEQHGRTFAERCAGYPVAIETLSRFKSHREQRRILERLAAGRLDIVIGTHRLLQKDVRFKDLGLAIVDEEQRFGVEHKEFFKRLRSSVDVLTLTATPIPRTLHMALLGLRDISNLATPPRNRHSILTKVARVSDDLLRRAILRELSRGGQVFIVHPRVEDIADFSARLASLVPEGRFGVGHGQMDPNDLEEVMARFLRGDLDALVSTTIVENGLDIPNANTMLVHEADRFGLSELHQLRGRVGRSDLQAYCYLLLPEHRVITPEGLRRLRALEEYDELGAGFQLALKDLEIRGAGNALGVEQSGQIAEIGYDLYCRLLETTVRQLQGQPVPEEELEVNLQLRGAAYLPETYIEDEKAVLEVYRRLDAARTDGDVDALRAEVQDRFGPLPEPAARVFFEAPLRRLARRARVPYAGIEREEQRLILKLHEWNLKAADHALRGLPQARDVRIPDEETLSFRLSLKALNDEAALRAEIRLLLEVLAEFREKRGARVASLPARG
jgi:transcription-repair coupling factor (superfamily II helicase)